MRFWTFGAGVVVAVLGLVGAGCTVHDPLYCDDTHPCQMIDRPYCDLQGIYPQSEGHGHTCIGNPFDGGLPPTADASIDGAAPPDGGAMCGNDTVEPGETCDGTALAGNDCTTIGEGFVGGTLACEASCQRFDTTGCTAPIGCGDDMVTGVEECDGANLAGATCVSRGFMGGMLDCTAGCVFDTSGCYSCGNGMRELTGGEACDGMDFGGSTCASLGFDGGTLACSGACTFDFSGCTNCGNGTKEVGEPCDGTDFGGATCTTVGAFQEGTLACTAGCVIDTSACIACGDAVAEGSEQCDGADLNGNNCTTIGAGYIGGTLSCNAGTCAFNTSACTSPPNCPNGAINAGEDCDPPALGAGTCSTATGGALVSGGLTCNGACHYDTAACYTCGNATVEGPETCDGTNLAGATCFSRGHDGGTLACAAGCMGFNEAACTDCGDGIAEGAEPCDGADLDGATCTSVGPGIYSGGALACNGTCSGFTTGSCYGPPTVPALRGPTNNSYVGSTYITGSLRPIFQWSASTLAGGPPPAITYDLQYSADPAFPPFPLTTTVSGGLTNHQPTMDLAVSAVVPKGSRYYWHVRACAAGACSAYSTTWRVNVGRSERDFNGDGYADVLVGANGNDAGGTSAGRAYLYFGAGGAPGTFSTTVDGTFTGLAANDGFGRSAAFAGDVNGDGFADIVIGADGNDAGGSGAGAAYVYFGGAAFDGTSDGTLLGSAANDSFGWSVASAGDVNGDGFADVLVGTPLNDLGGASAGAAFLYFGGPGAFDSGADGTLIGVAAFDTFGSAVSSAGDINDDGYSDIVIGAPANDVAGVDAGRAYVFFGGAGTFDAMADGTYTAQLAGDNFGISVASAGDVNNDGYADAIVGANMNDTAGTNAGRAYVYFGGATFDAIADGTLTGAAANDHFGTAVATLGDANADGYADVVVGANLNDSGAADAGRAYVYFGGSGAGFTTTTAGMVTGGSPGDNLGFSVACAGDTNGDGYSDLVVGAYQNDVAGSNAGRVYIYFGGAGSAFSASPVSLMNGAAAGDQFGYSVARLDAWPSGLDMCAQEG